RGRKSTAQGVAGEGNPNAPALGAGECELRRRRQSMQKRCLICEKDLVPDVVAFQDATIWTCDGNYGSRVYDPLEGNVFLEAAICDACLVRKKGLIEE